MLYLWMKTLHIISATVLFGTGLGSAYYLWRAHLSANPQVIALTARHVVTADWLFTASTVALQPLTGLWLAWYAGIPLTHTWILLSLALYALAGACWLPVVWMQIRIRDLAFQALANHTDLPPPYYRYMRLWFLLGWPAFIALIIVFFLMVFKPA